MWFAHKEVWFAHKEVWFAHKFDAVTPCFYLPELSTDPDLDRGRGGYRRRFGLAPTATCTQKQNSNSQTNGPNQAAAQASHEPFACVLLILGVPRRSASCATRRT